MTANSSKKRMALRKNLKKCASVGAFEKSAIKSSVVPKHGIQAKTPRIQSLAGEMARRGNGGKVQTPDFSTVSPRLEIPQRTRDSHI